MELTELFLCGAVWANFIIISLYLKAVIDVRVHPVTVEKRYQKWLLEKI